MKKIKVLFLCVHNSARSQMAEAWLNHFYGDWFEAKSAGVEPGELNSLVVLAMDELGIDISRNRTKSICDVIESGPFDWVITVCDESSMEGCPVFPGPVQRINWSFPDPALLTGTFEQRMDSIRIIRNKIRELVRTWGAFVKDQPPFQMRNR